MDKQNVVYLYNEILLNYEKEQSTDAWYNLDVNEKHYAKWKKLGTRVQILYDSIHMKVQNKHI